MEEPLTLNIPWVESPLFKKLLGEAKLPSVQEEIVRKYAEDGYVVFDFPGADLDAHASAIREVLFSPPDSLKGRVQDAWKVSNSVKRIATDEGVLSLLRMLYRREPIPFQTLNFILGTEQATHSDTVHFHCVPHRFMCGVWVALEDIDLDNGPLHVYPGSHKLPVLNMHDLGLPSGRESYGAYEQAIRMFVSDLGLEKKQILLKKGQALVWAANLLHGGEKICDKQRTRLSQVTHCYFEGCLYYTPMHSDPYLGNVALREIVSIVDGRKIPNVYGGKPIPEPLTPSLSQKERGIRGRSLRRIPSLLRALSR